MRTEFTGDPIPAAVLARIVELDRDGKLDLARLGHPRVRRVVVDLAVGLEGAAFGNEGSTRDAYRDTRLIRIFEQGGLPAEDDETVVGLIAAIRQDLVDQGRVEAQDLSDAALDALIRKAAVGLATLRKPKEGDNVANAAAAAVKAWKTDEGSDGQDDENVPKIVEAMKKRIINGDLASLEDLLDGDLQGQLTDMARQIAKFDNPLEESIIEKAAQAALKAWKDDKLRPSPRRWPLVVVLVLAAAAAGSLVTYHWPALSTLVRLGAQ